MSDSFDTIDCRMLGSSVLHYPPEFVQILVHRVSIQLSHPSPPPSLPALNLSQHQGLFKRVGSSHHMAKILELHFGISPSYRYPGLISFRIDWIDHLAVGQQGLLRVFSSTMIWKHQFLDAQHSSRSSSYILIWLLEKA